MAETDCMGGAHGRFGLGLGLVWLECLNEPRDAKDLIKPPIGTPLDVS